ncbi:MAG: response regulator transcription factor [Acidimicrobiia bacterium]|nr:response regulator transcription factor [Acidimicrobiia bacterium]MBJ7381842.1 response regulator transcription factor [Acidimicrobiia bacterium]
MSGTPPTALVVDDSPDILNLVSSALQRDGFVVSQASSGDDAIALARRDSPDLIVLDVMMPGTDGIETCRLLREFTDAYIVMLTARADEVDKLVGLSIGADDYMVKPFSPRELVARAHAMLRRPRRTGPESSLRIFSGMNIDTGTREVWVDNALVAITRTEYEILDSLASDPRSVITRTALVQRIWGQDWFGDDHVLDVHMSSLRRKIGDASGTPRFITTVRGVGYRFVGTAPDQT